MISWLVFKNYLLSRRSGALVRIIAWHCIIGIGMGVAALVIVLSVMNGFNQTIRTRMLSVVPHLVVSSKNPDPTPADRAHLLQVLRGIAPIERVDRYEEQDMILRSVEGIFGGVIAKGYEPESLFAMLTRVWKGSRSATPPPVLASSDLNNREVVLGVDLARSMGIFEGDDVILVPPEVLLLPKGEMPVLQKYRVKSLVSTQIPEVDSKLMFYNLAASGPRLRSHSLEPGFEVRLRDPYQAEMVQSKLIAYGFKSQTWMERDMSLFFALKMESYAMTLFLSLAVLITSFSIVTVMVLLMSQKRRDIGLFMALGMSLSRTRAVFLRVGLMLSFIGILGGTLIGVGVCVFLDKHPLELLPDFYTDSTLPAKLTWQILLFVLSSSSVIAVVSAWLPVWRYVIVNPSECLRKAA